VQEERTLVKIGVLETGHTILSFLAGGDVLLEKLVRSFPPNYKLKIITTDFGIKHWRESGLDLEEYILSSGKSKAALSSLNTFISYLKRTWESYKILKSLDLQMILSTTDIFPDVIPAFMLKLTRPKVIWITWVHHLIPPPYKRPGNVIVNSISYLMQIISLLATRINANIIICRNQGIYQTIKRFGFCPSKLRVIDTGVDFYKVANHKITKKYNYDGLFLGRLQLLKGVFDLPTIWAHVIQELPSARLAIIGSGTSKDISKLKEIIQRAGLKRNIKILGVLPDNDMLDVLKSSKIFLLTDYEAGFSLAAAEAMSAGLPVVAYNLPIFGQTYKKGFITVQREEKQQMAIQIIRLLKNSSLRQSLGKLALSQAKLLDRSRTMTSFLKLINETPKRN
jgi:glycosyltransferase involved in cell wall biosynthesis